MLLAVYSISSNAANGPVKCPSLKSIQAAGLNFVIPSNGLGYVTAYMPGSKYDTNETWNFTITGDNVSTAKSAEQALSIARKALTKLGAPIGPHSDDGVQYECRYESSFLLIAMAFTPPVDPGKL
jgi:hypothetical protein